MSPFGFFDFSKRLDSLSVYGDPLESLKNVVDFEFFRPLLTQHLAFSSDKIKGGRPLIDDN